MQKFVLSQPVVSGPQAEILELVGKLHSSFSISECVNVFQQAITLTEIAVSEKELPADEGFKAVLNLSEIQGILITALDLHGKMSKN